jgi:chromosome transmission fidelity protein 4
LTCGEDGDVRIWQGFDDIDSVSVSIGEKCTCVVQKQSKFYTSNELNEIRKYDFNSHEFEDLIATFTLPVTTMAINKSNTHMVCGSADFEIRLIDLSTLKYTSFTGHAAPILHICIDPLEKYFLSSSCDGSIRIWSIKNLNLVKTLPNMHEKSNDLSTTKTYSKISWHKDGNLIAVPSHKEVQFFERELWQLKFKIEADANVSITKFSPDGKTIALCTQANWIYVHSIITKSLLYKNEYTKKGASICSFVWNPVVHNDKNEIILCDTKGQMGKNGVQLECLKAK